MIKARRSQILVRVLRLVLRLGGRFLPGVRLRAACGRLRKASGMIPFHGGALGPGLLRDGLLRDGLFGEGLFGPGLRQQCVFRG
jgi:hypothetical protein